MDNKKIEVDNFPDCDFYHVYPIKASYSFLTRHYYLANGCEECWRRERKHLLLCDGDKQYIPKLTGRIEP